MPKPKMAPMDGAMKHDMNGAMKKDHMMMGHNHSMMMSEEPKTPTTKLQILGAKTFWLRYIVLAAAFTFFTVLNIVQPSGDVKWGWHFGIWLPITAYVVFWEGRKYFRIYKDLIQLNMNMDVLLTLGAHVLFLYSTIYGFIRINDPIYSYEAMWEGTAALILIYNIGRRMENKLRKSSQDLYRKLSELKNSKIIVLRNNQEVMVKSSELKIGETIIVQKCGFVPVDTTLNEAGDFNYSNITGESKTMHLNAGETCLSGSYNEGSNIKMTVAKTAANSTISHIVNKIEELSERKPKMQVIADKVMNYFIPSVLVLSVATFVVWLIIGYVADIQPWPWISTHNPAEAAVMAGVSVLAIACPCALGIATPLVYTVSSMLAAKIGVVVNEAKALEEVNRVQVVIFDKTGTITTDKLEIVKIHGDKNYIGLAKALENNIKHPIAYAIAGVEGEMLKTDAKVQIKPGGVESTWKNQKIEIKRYSGNEFPVASEHTNVALYAGGKVKLVFEMKNELRDHVIETIEQLKKAKLEVVMISGDSEGVTSSVAKQVGIENFHHSATPNDKYEIIKKLQETKKVAFVGDGFNDALVIKQSDVSIAFASGSDITNNLASFSITNGDFASIEKILLLSKLNKHNVIRALVYAFGFNIVFVPLAMLLIVWPWVSALIMVASDLLVTENAFAYKLIGSKKLGIKKDKKSKDAQPKDSPMSEMPDMKDMPNMAHMSHK